MQKGHWNFDRTATDLQNTLGSMVILTTLRLPISEHGMSYPMLILTSLFF